MPLSVHIMTYLLEFYAVVWSAGRAYGLWNLMQQSPLGIQP